MGGEKFLVLDSPEIGWRTKHLEIVDWAVRVRVRTSGFGTCVEETWEENWIRWKCDCGHEFEEWQSTCQDAIRRGGLNTCGPQCEFEKPATDRDESTRSGGKVVLYMRDEIRDAVRVEAEKAGVSFSAWVSAAVIAGLFGGLEVERKERKEKVKMVGRPRGRPKGSKNRDKSAGADVTVEEDSPQWDEAADTVYDDSYRAEKERW